MLFEFRQLIEQLRLLLEGFGVVALIAAPIAGVTGYAFAMMYASLRRTTRWGKKVGVIELLAACVLTGVGSCHAIFSLAERDPGPLGLALVAALTAVVFGFPAFILGAILARLYRRRSFVIRPDAGSAPSSEHGSPPTDLPK